MIYMDNNATTPVHEQVAASMYAALTLTYGNPSSLHLYGRAARMAIDKARSIIAAAIGAQTDEIIFTSGGTESDNLAIRGVCGQRVGLHVVTSEIEHHAVLRTCDELSALWRLDHAKVGGDGVIDLEHLDWVCALPVSLISIMHSNNETGVIQPIAAVAEIARSRGAILHVDAVQSFGKVPLDVEELGVDLMSISAHKLYGPKGIGALYVRKGTSIGPLIFGGNQELGLRAGTENVPGIVGFGAAAKIAMADMDDVRIRQTGLTAALITGVLAAIPDTWLNGDGERLPNTANLGFKGVDSEALLLMLGQAGIAASSGAACESGKVEPSHVLKAMGLSDEDAKSCVRFSIGRHTTLGQIAEVVGVLKEIIPDLRSMARLGGDSQTTGSRGDLGDLMPFEPPDLGEIDDEE